MSPEIERPLPPYMQVVTHLRDRIVSGELGEGETLPSERQLVADWGISRSTAGKVMTELRHQGLVVSQQGSGTVVAARGTVHHSPADRFDAAQTTGRIYPPSQYAKILDAGRAPAPEHVALALAVETDTEVIRRQRVTYNEVGPVSASTSWFSGELAERVPQLLVAERIMGGTPKAIEDAVGWSWTDGQDLVGARIATDEDAELLEIRERPAAVLIGYNSLFDAEGRTIEYGEFIAYGDRLSRYTYARPRD